MKLSIETLVILLIVVLVLVTLGTFFGHPANFDSTQRQSIDHSRHDNILDIIKQTNKLLYHINNSHIELSQKTVQAEDAEIIREKYEMCQHENSHLNDALLVCNNKLKTLSSSTTTPPPVLPSPATSTINTMTNSTSSSSSSSSIDGYWLVIGIPTVSRPNNEDYLLQTLASIASQLSEDSSSLFYYKIVIVILNMEGPTHTRFSEAQTLYSIQNQPYKSHYFRFLTVTSSQLIPDVKPGTTAQNDPGHEHQPGYTVRKQTRSLVTLLRAVMNITTPTTYGNKHDYYLFLEDDMVFCPYVLDAIHYLLNKASLYHKDWIAIRASYGMNGIFMRFKDLSVFSNYLLEHQSRRPPDHLVVEWFGGEKPQSRAYKGNRVNVGFKYNLFNHIGKTSTLRMQQQANFPLCYGDLVYPTVFHVEAYDPQACPKDDIWPCNIPQATAYTIPWHLIMKSI